MGDVGRLIEEREKTHGDFGANARRMQAIVAAVGSLGNEVADSAVAMIAMKLARIGSGRWDEADHWQDIAGYAGLVVREIGRGQPPAA